MALALQDALSFEARIGYHVFMATIRTNEDWVAALTRPDPLQSAALADLRDLLLRATLYTLATHLDDVSGMPERDRLALAEDCAQEALQTVLDHLQDFRGESKFTTWVYKFGINTALTRARRERWKAVSLDALADDEQKLDWFQWKDSLRTVNSETPALRSEVGSALQDAMRSELTLRQLQVLKWIAFDDVPMDVVVERLNSNRNAVYKLLHDARLRIRQHLAARGYPVEEIFSLFQVE